jgi:2-dehydro-3-deoxygluconokinase
MRVASIGECMVELTLPRGDEGSRVGFAGDTLNAAVYLKRSAPEIEVAYVTALGTDPLSARMITFFASESLDTGLIERRADRVPGLYAISLDTKGERSFTYWRDSSAARTLFLPPAEVTPDRLAGFDLIYLSGITLAVLAPEARAALAGFLDGYRRRGGRVAFDSNYRPRLWPNAELARREIAAFWALTDVGLPSLDDEMALFGEAGEAAVLARLASAGVRRGALKRGAEGPLAIGAGVRLPAFPPARKVVDTTAAGDSFNGAYLAALMRGETEAACLAAGHAMASEVIGHPGAIIPRTAAETRQPPLPRG